MVINVRKLFVYLKQYKKESILGPLFKLLEAVLELFVPVVMAKIIDVGIAHGDRPYIFKMAAVLVCLGLLGLLLSVTAQFFAAKAAVGFVKNLRHAMFAHIQSFSFIELDEIGTSTLITRMTSDMNQVQTGVNLSLRLLLRSPLVVLGAMVMAFFIDTKSALIFVAAIPVLSAIVAAIMAVCIPLYKKVQQRLDQLLSTTRENLTGVRVLRAFCKEKDEINKFSVENGALTEIQKHTGRISALMNPATYVVVNLAVVWLIYTGAVNVNSGVMSQGEVVALYNYMTQILVELIKFANLVVTVTKSIACAKRIQAVLERPSSRTEGAKTESGSGASVVFEHVSLTYKGSPEEALTDITFSCEQGETVGIIGGTGSGKSSLVHMIPRFYEASSGQVFVGGTDVKDYKLSDLRKKVGIAMQKAVLFKGTIRDNMKWRKADASDQEILSAINAAQASELVSEKKGGLDFMIEQNGRNLSGGQRQRLTVARALVGRPEILILDDSASALDFATDARLRKALRSLPYHPTVFIVSQRVSSIRHADKIVVLDDGKVAAVGTHDALVKNCGIYREIYASQGGLDA